MKRFVLCCLLAFGSSFFFNAYCGGEQVETGVLINGIRWAKSNVAAPGTFATNPQDVGCFYQWNSKRGWPVGKMSFISATAATDGSTTWNENWDGGYSPSSSSDIWKSTSDPSPVGWHVPTYMEIRTLLDTAKVTNEWTIQNSVYGRKFTEKATGNSIFLPVSGCRPDRSGILIGTGDSGFYWGSTIDINSWDNEASCLMFDYKSTDLTGSYNRAIGYTVRSVYNAYSKQKVDESSPNNYSEGSSHTTDTIKEINGVRWATRNVAAPGFFVANTYDVGMFYQWNSKVGWPATGSIGSITATDGTIIYRQVRSSSSSSSTWTLANDPSPSGWRIPTYVEITTLLDTAKVTNEWTTQNSVYGRRFTEKATGNSIFLPVSGCRISYSGILIGVGSAGFYWSSTADGIIAYYLNFGSIKAGWSNYGDYTQAFAVRPVAK